MDTQLDFNVVEFIEIGTSDFDTYLQELGDNSKGISVEPLKNYLDRLPDKPLVKKANYAISNRAGELEFFFVPDKLIADYKLPSWVKGCGTVGKPHENVIKYIRSRWFNPDDFIKSVMVPVKTYGQLLEEFGVKGVNKLKIDTEGHDLIVLDGMMEYCETHPESYPNYIKFESNELAPRELVDETIEKLIRCGYILQST